MAKVIGTVYEETDYNQFKKLADNRDVLSGRLSKLIASISERYVLNPIVVNEKMQIIDGQGRFEARKALKKPIHYIISFGATSDDCRRMNRYNSSWTKLDYAKSYARAGNQNYVWLLKAIKDAKIAISTILETINRNDSRGGFEQGKLIFDESDYHDALFLKKTASEISEALQCSDRPNRAFYRALYVMIKHKKYNHAHMINAAKKNRTSYSQMSKMSAQLAEFERIYNYRIPASNKVYFTDYMRNKGSAVRSYDSNYFISNMEYTDKDVRTLQEA